MGTWCLCRLQNLTQNLDAWCNGLELVFRDRPEWKPLVSCITNSSLNQLRTLPSGPKPWCTRGSNNNRLHHPTPLRKEDKKKTKREWDNSCVTQVSSNMQLCYVTAFYFHSKFVRPAFPSPWLRLAKITGSPTKLCPGLMTLKISLSRSWVMFNTYKAEH